MPSHTTEGNTGLDGEAILLMCSIKSASGMNLDFEIIPEKKSQARELASQFRFVFSSFSVLCLYRCTDMAPDPMWLQPPVVVPPKNFNSRTYQMRTQGVKQTQRTC